MEKYLEIRSLSKSFGDLRVLEGISFDLFGGECLGLLGANGAGKTTTIRSISGRVKPDDGAIHFVDGHKRNSERLEIGVVPQEIALYEKLSCLENLEIFAGLAGVDRSDISSRTEWALEWTDLRNRKNDEVRKLSGGMRRRLNLACGVLHRPNIILLDEPTVGVDPQNRARIWEMVEELKLAGSSILLCTHQLYEAERVCDRIAIIEAGRIVAIGTVAELIQSSMGAKHQVTIRLEAPVDGPIDNLDISDDGSRLEGSVSDMVQELPALIAKIKDRGAKIVGLRVVAPSLESVFLRVTGREPRDD